MPAIQEPVNPPAYRYDSLEERGRGPAAWSCDRREALWFQSVFVARRRAAERTNWRASAQLLSLSKAYSR